MTTAGHAFEEHTAEAQVRIWAPTLPALFSEAALALAELMAGRPVPPTGKGSELVTVESTDRDALLIDWLNELIYRTEMSGRLYPSVRLDRLDEHTLTGTIGAVETPRPAEAVKAATLHGLRIAETPEGYSASVILDV